MPCTATSASVEAISLFTVHGERKYLSEDECGRYYAELDVIEDPAERTFCEMLYWTGCRPIEALGLTALNVDLDEGFIVIRSAKKRGELKGRHFRAVPVDDDFLYRLDDVHGIRQAQASHSGQDWPPLWTFGRTKGWRLVRAVMRAAGITGVRACARGLRHSLGVGSVTSNIPVTELQNWLGHASLRTTAIYVNAIGPETRLIAKRLWQRRRRSTTRYLTRNDAL